MASKRLLESLATQLADYRKGEIETLDARHVERWISQFEPKLHDSILQEVIHVFERTYITRSDVKKFLKELSSNPALTGDKPKKFWQGASVLRVQQNGSSQKEMLELLGKIIEKEHGVDITEPSQDGNVAIYIDDVIFSGGHVRGDLVPWITDTAPKSATLHIIVFALHLGGQWYAKQKMEKAAVAAGKDIKLVWWRCLEVEDRRAYINTSDVLRPVKIPDHELSQEYAKMLTEAKYPPRLRTPGSIGQAKFFSTEQARDLLEQQFLIKGTEIREMCPNLNEFQRPLGNTLLSTLGFGAMIATFRNCPNNCPLAFWVDHPWYPLCPRRTN